MSSLPGWAKTINVRYDGPARFTFVGDPKLAARYVPLARVIQGNLRNHLALGSVNQGHRLKILNDGTVIRCLWDGSSDIIEIDVTEAAGSLPVEKIKHGFVVYPRDDAYPYGTLASGYSYNNTDRCFTGIGYTEIKAMAVSNVSLMSGNQFFTVDEDVYSFWHSPHGDAPLGVYYDPNFNPVLATHCFYMPFVHKDYGNLDFSIKRPSLYMMRANEYPISGDIYLVPRTIYKNGKPFINLITNLYIAGFSVITTVVDAAIVDRFAVILTDLYEDNLYEVDIDGNLTFCQTLCVSPKNGRPTDLDTFLHLHPWKFSKSGSKASCILNKLDGTDPRTFIVSVDIDVSGGPMTASVTDDMQPGYHETYYKRDSSSGSFVGATVSSIYSQLDDLIDAAYVAAGSPADFTTTQSVSGSSSSAFSSVLGETGMQGRVPYGLAYNEESLIVAYVDYETRQIERYTSDQANSYSGTMTDVYVSHKLVSEEASGTIDIESTQTISSGYWVKYEIEFPSARKVLISDHTDIYSFGQFSGEKNYVFGRSGVRSGGTFVWTEDFEEVACPADQHSGGAEGILGESSEYGIAYLDVLNEVVVKQGYSISGYGEELHEYQSGSTRIDYPGTWVSSITKTTAEKTTIGSAIYEVIGDKLSVKDQLLYQNNYKSESTTHSSSSISVPSPLGPTWYEMGYPADGWVLFEPSEGEGTNYVLVRMDLFVTEPGSFGYCIDSRKGYTRFMMGNQLYVTPPFADSPISESFNASSFGNIAAVIGNTNNNPRFTPIGLF